MKNNRGFSLVELMATCVLVAIFMMFAAPNFNAVNHRKVAISLADELGTALSLARSLAVTQGETVGVCASDDEATCSGTWTDGWIVFIDENRNGTQESGTEVAQRVYKAEYDDLATVNTALGNMVLFGSTGAAQIASLDSFQICLASGESDRNRAVSITPVGSVFYSNDSDGDSVHEDLTGTKISCP